MKTRRFTAATALTAGCLAASLASPAMAQDDEIVLEEVVVTGTYLRGKRQEDSSSPLAIIDANQLNAIGATQISDLVQTMTINNGSQNNPDAFTQGSTTGTANFNLRGLGVASTLVLLNGRRQVNTASVTNDGVQFIDTNSLVPQIAIGRIEIVKDGAAAIYGTDAVAGVVNLITDDDFEGFATSARFQTVTDEGSQRDLLFQAKYGYQADDLSILVAASYFDRTSLTTQERRLSTRSTAGAPGSDFSILGNPGAYIGLGGGALPPGVPIVDPTGCDSVGGFTRPLAPPVAGLQPGFCGFDFGDFFNLVPEEQRFQAYAKIKYDFSETAMWSMEASYANNEASRGNSPTFPFLLSPIVPAENPFNIFGEPVVYLGRAVGNGGNVSPQLTKNETIRLSTSLRGDFESWSYDLGFTWARNNHFRSTEDTLVNEFRAALSPPSDSDPAGRPAGEIFNPFATRFSVAPNSQAIIDYIIGQQTDDAVSELFVVDAVVSTTLGEAPGGDIGIAFGFQYRDESLSSDLDDNTNNGNFGFLSPTPTPDFSGSLSPFAFFTEVLVPLTDELEFSGALRYEDYGGQIGNTLDPKVSFLYRPSDVVTLRASYSTSFRAPSVFQQFGVNTSLNQVTDPINGGNVFAAIQTQVPGAGGRGLLPEESDAFNLGLSLSPMDGLSIDLDYFDFSFENAIITTAFQELVNANPLDPTVVRRSAAGTIVQVNNDYVNASNISTNGLDIRINYEWETEGGAVIAPFFEGTWLFGYDFTTGSGTEVDGLGERNFGLLGIGSRPNPEWRFNTGFSYTSELHDFRFFYRYIDSVNDNENPGSTIGSFATVDLQYGLNLGEVYESFGDTRLTLGAINLFDKTPPLVDTNGGFEARLHDPRGRVFYVELGVSF